jgi:hypothetical protein
LLFKFSLLPSSLQAVLLLASPHSKEGPPPPARALRSAGANNHLQHFKSALRCYPTPNCYKRLWSDNPHHSTNKNPGSVLPIRDLVWISKNIFCTFIPLVWCYKRSSPLPSTHATVAHSHAHAHLALATVAFLRAI